jgi:hypothetical protein
MTGLKSSEQEAQEIVDAIPQTIAVLRPDGQPIYGNRSLLQYTGLTMEDGQTLRWYATGTDIDDRKRAEERTRNENLALREDIDRASMFEEIVGSAAFIREPSPRGQPRPTPYRVAVPRHALAVLRTSACTPG